MMRCARGVAIAWKTRLPKSRVKIEERFHPTLFSVPPRQERHTCLFHPTIGQIAGIKWGYFEGIFTRLFLPGTFAVERPPRGRAALAYQTRARGSGAGRRTG